MQNKNNPLISVIMNCHNGKKFLKSSLNSLIRQTYKNWELIFFDNNSKDDSIKIVKYFNDKRIKIFKSNKKFNLYHARNLALAKSKGKYLSFLDVDDLWEKNKLEVQLYFIKKNKKFKILYSNYFVKNQSDKKKHIKYSKKLNSGLVTQFLLNNYTVGILTVFFERSLINHSFFNKRYNIVGDFDCFLRLSKTNQFAYLDTPLATYRIHNNNYSINNLNEYIMELNYWLKNNFIKYKKYSFFNLRYYLIKLRLKYFIKNLLGV
jgi:glycosyltransferase involved in cell wall biosynthesis